MKISYNWLKKYIDLPLSVDEISVMLTDTGLEVESVEKVESVKGGLEGILIGEVTFCTQHPNAEKLSITKVNVGRDEELSIVCGAPNVALGQKVPVATIGTKLYSGEDSFIIKKSKLRGELSEGMICAEDELGLGDSHDGIMVLDQDAEIGMKAKDYFNIQDDYVFEIGLTPNRTDGMSHIGVARDLLAAYKHLKKSTAENLNIPSVAGFAVDNQNLDINVEVKDTDACPRYAGISISNIKVGASPEWMQTLLKTIGVRPINSIVDITNFVLWETGQPLHAFDADAISGKTVVVQKLAEGTNFTTLDETERKLTQNDLMICDGLNPMCIGGVFGGLDSGVSEKTQNIFLESAYFDAATIRKTARHHNLQTDASFRFERGIDPNNVLYALKRAAMLIKEIAGGEISSEIKDVHTKQFDKAQVLFNIKSFNSLVGKEIPKDEILNILQSLDFEILENANEESYLLAVPTYRVDVTRPADVTEEILRIYGYNNIEIGHQVNSAITLAQKPDNEKLKLNASVSLSALSFYEIMNNSLTKAAFFTENKLIEDAFCVKIFNPLSTDLDILRPNLIAGGLDTMRYNINRKATNLKLYEFGKTYTINPEKLDGVNPLKKYNEEQHLALFLSGNKTDESWNSKAIAYNFFDLKETVHKLLYKLNIDFKKLNINKLEQSLFNEGLQYSVNNKAIVVFGSIHPMVLKSADIAQSVYYADFQWDNILKLQKIEDMAFETISKHPEVRRDLSMLIPAHVSYEDIQKLAFKTERNILKEVGLFDIYEDNKIGKDKKSYAIKFILLDKNKTLTDKLIDKTMKRFIAAFSRELGAELR